MLKGGHDTTPTCAARPVLGLKGGPWPLPDNPATPGRPGESPGSRSSLIARRTRGRAELPRCLRKAGRRRRRRGTPSTLGGRRAQQSRCRRSDGAGGGQAHDRLRGIRSSGADVVVLVLLGAAKGLVLAGIRLAPAPAWAGNEASGTIDHDACPPPARERPACGETRERAARRPETCSSADALLLQSRIGEANLGNAPAPAGRPFSEETRADLQAAARPQEQESR